MVDSLEWKTDVPGLFTRALPGAITLPLAITSDLPSHRAVVLLFKVIKHIFRCKNVLI